MSGASRRGSRSIRTREQVIDAALAVITEVGIDGLTMQKVAAHLGIGVMTLYTYVANKDDLLDALVGVVQQRAFDTVPMPGAVTTWQDDLDAIFTRMHWLLTEHPALALLLLRSGRTYAATSSDQFLRTIETVLAKMGAAGIDAVTAARTFSAAQLYVAGFVLRELERDRASDADTSRAGAWADRLRTLPGERYPNLAAGAEGFLTSSSIVQLRFGLHAIFAGCTVRL
jgi:AcrR family transcriptional regulator